MLLACGRVGAIFVALNSHLRGHFLSHQLADCGARLVVVDKPGRSMATPVLGSTAVERLITLDDDRPAGDDGVLSYADLCSTGDVVTPEAIAPGDPLAIIYTSGTTGNSKGCVVSHGYFIASGEASATAGWVMPTDRIFTAFPHYHASFQLSTLSASLVTGAPLIWEPEFRASTFMARAAAERATMIWGVGTMAAAILAQGPSPNDLSPGLRLSAWAPLDPALQGQFQERFGGVVNCEAYGQTEAVPIAMAPWDRPARRRAVLGTPNPNLDVRVAGDANQSVGEIQVRPRTEYAIFSGYWGNPDATRAAKEGAWHRTGDLGRFDADGNLLYVDRVKDAVRRRAVNVSCFELEQAIAQHPHVVDVAVTAVPSPLGDDDIKASLVLVQGSELSPGRLFEFFRDSLPYFAIPRYVEIRPALPRTGSGRVRKDVIREEGLSADAWDFDKLGLQVARQDRRG